jgi:hypothetical protein
MSIFKIPYVIDTGDGYGYNNQVYIKASSKKLALEYLVEVLIEMGDEMIWGSDPAFDLGGVERSEGRTTSIENQMWYVTGVSDDPDDEETLVKAIVVDPKGIEVVSKDQVRHEDGFFDADAYYE